MLNVLFTDIHGPVLFGIVTPGTESTKIPGSFIWVQPLFEKSVVFFETTKAFETFLTAAGNNGRVLNAMFVIALPAASLIDV